MVRHLPLDLRKLELGLRDAGRRGAKDDQPAGGNHTGIISAESKFVAVVLGARDVPSVINSRLWKFPPA